MEKEMMNNKTSNQPLVSVILPTYNRAHIVSKALQSVLSQTYRNFEVIVIDDGSTDNTKEIITNIACKDPRVKYFRNNENKGPAGARNVGINLAKGEFIAFIDDDVEWFPHKLEKQVNLLQTLPEDYAVVYSGLYKIFGHKKIYFSPRDVYSKEGIVFSFFFKGMVGDPPSMLVRKSALFDVGLFDEKLPIGEDRELAFRLFKKYKFEVIDEPLYISYDTPNSASKQEGAICARALEYILKKYMNDFKKNKKALAHIYFLCGKNYIFDNQKRLGLKYLKSALKNNPFQIKFLIAFVIAFLGTNLFKKVVYLKRKLKIYF
jgi:glycosyltransferase involved in cell wall biosynthesis